MSKANGTTKEITPEEAQAVLDKQLQAKAQSFVNGYQALQGEYGNARFVAMIQTQDETILLEVSHVIIDGRLAQIVK